MSTLILVAVLSVVAGVTLGLLGGGGSILAVPILVFAGGLEPRSAIATSLLMVGVSSGVAAALHRSRGGVDVRAGLTLGLASMLGAYAGGRAGQHFPAAWLLAAFTVVMVITAIAMMRPRHAADDAPSAPASWMKTSAVGLAVGALTGLVGAGGGFVIVPALVLLCGLPMRRAVGTSLLVIAMNSVAGFAGTAHIDALEPTMVASATAAATLGSVVGVLSSAHIPAVILRKGFAWFVLAMSIFMVMKQLPSGLLGSMAGPKVYVVLALVVVAIVFGVAAAKHLRRAAPAA